MKLILEQRKLNSDTRRYELDQVKLLIMLQNIWGQSLSTQAIHHDDRLWLFGMIMLLPQNCQMFERLAEGVCNCGVLDDPSLSPKHIFTKLAFDFNNDAIDIHLPPNASDVKGYDVLNPNNPNRIRINRDCEIYSTTQTFISYSFLTNLFSNFSFILLY